MQEIIRSNREKNFNKFKNENRKTFLENSRIQNFEINDPYIETFVKTKIVSKSYNNELIIKNLQNNTDINILYSTLLFLKDETNKIKFENKIFADNDYELIKILLVFIEKNNNKITKFYSSKIISNLLGTNYDENLDIYSILLNLDCFQIFFNLLCNEINSTIFMQSVLAIGNIFADEKIVKFPVICNKRDEVAKKIIDNFVSNINLKSIENEEILIWCLVNLLMVDSNNFNEDYNSYFYQFLVNLLMNTNNDNIINDILKLFYNRAEKKVDDIYFIYNQGFENYFKFCLNIIEKFIKEPKNYTTLMLILDIYAEIIKNNNFYIQNLLLFNDGKLFDMIIKLHSSKLSLIRIKILYLLIQIFEKDDKLINLVCDNDNLIKEIIYNTNSNDKNLYESLEFIQKIVNTNNFSLLKKLIDLNLLNNFISILDDYKIIEIGIIKKILNLLIDIFNWENKIFLLIFQSIGGTETLLKMQHHNSIEIFNTIEVIFNLFFSDNN